jgi:hypothetical protein
MRSKFANDDESTAMTVVTTMTTGKSSPVKRKRSLRFSLASNQCFPIPHIRDLEDEEVAAVWYEKKEYDAMKKKIIPTLRKMIKGEKIEENNKQSGRGLEYRTRQGCYQRQENKRQAMAVAMDEQKRQRDECIQDDERLSEAYRNASFHCQDAACALGLEDQADIEEELERMRIEEANGLASSNTSSKLNASDSKKSRGINSLLKRVGLRRRPLAVIMEAA